MTELPPQDDGTRERLMAVETGLRHFREISEIHQQQTRTDITALQDRNQRQDMAIEVIEEKMLNRVEQIRALLWSGLKWGAALTATTLLAIILKGLNLI
jgi:hypothetical protein